MIYVYEALNKGTRVKKTNEAMAQILQSNDLIKSLMKFKEGEKWWSKKSRQKLPPCTKEVNIVYISFGVYPEVGCWLKVMHKCDLSG